MRHMKHFLLALLAVWALACSDPKPTVQRETESVEPAPNEDPSSEETNDDSSNNEPPEMTVTVPRAPTPSMPPVAMPEPQGAGGMGDGAGGSPPMEPPHSDVIEVTDGSFTPGEPPAPAAESMLSQIVNIVGPPA